MGKTSGANRLLGSSIPGDGIIYLIGLVFSIAVFCCSFSVLVLVRGSGCWMFCPAGRFFFEVQGLVDFPGNNGVACIAIRSAICFRFRV